MTKLDLKKKYKEFYSGKPGEVIIVDIPEFNFLMIDGQGYPGTSQEYQDAMQTLYPVSYTLKFMMKNKNKDYTVMPLEGLWWAKDLKVFTTEFMDRKDEWEWTSMVLQPDFITQELVNQAISELQEKEKSLPSLEKLKFKSYHEGLSGQIMHIGPYSYEGPSIEKLHSKIQEEGGIFDGHVHKHHEIYLSDPRRTKPDRLKTVIRQPFKTIND